MGARLLAGSSPAAPALCVSGRIGFEIVQKAVVADIGVLAAVGAPSSLAVRPRGPSGARARAGSSRGGRYVVYSAPGPPRRVTAFSVGGLSYGRGVRLLHTSDWHLGRSFHGVGMLGAQAAYVDHLIEVVETEQVDLVVVSGDVYDRALPPVDAVELADETFARLAASRATTVVSSGNHDSPARLGFNARLADAAGVHLRTRWQDVGTPVLLEDEHGPVAVHAHPLPRARRRPRRVAAARAQPRGRAHGRDDAGRRRPRRTRPARGRW